MSIHERSGISRATSEQYPLTERIRTPVGRALAVFGLLAASGAVVAGFARAEILLVAIGLLAWIPTMAAVNVVAGGVTAMRGSELDERERERRGHAQALAHRITGAFLLAAVIVASAVLPTDLERDHVIAGLFAVFPLQLAAPSLVLAATSRLPERG